MNNKIFLIGMMGAGKTTIGFELSKVNKIPFIDVDQIIDSNNFIIKNSIEDFRNREKLEIEKINSYKNCLIVSIGGGAVLSEENRIIIKKNYSIYLKGSIEELISRINYQNSFRPLIQSEYGSDIDINVFKSLFNKREKIYNQLSNFTVNTDKKNISEIVQIIHKKLIKNEIIY
tara:strand:+ start:10764 stop:11285 length:522 start_codon:yes stop_codon:yes gene_type:complete